MVGFVIFSCICVRTRLSPAGLLLFSLSIGSVIWKITGFEKLNFHVSGFCLSVSLLFQAWWSLPWNDLALLLMEEMMTTRTNHRIKLLRGVLLMKRRKLTIQLCFDFLKKERRYCVFQTHKEFNALECLHYLSQAWINVLYTFLDLYISSASSLKCVRCVPDSKNAVLETFFLFFFFPFFVCVFVFVCLPSACKGKIHLSWNEGCELIPCLISCSVNLMIRVENKHWTYKCRTWLTVPD